LVFIVSQDVG